MNRRLLAAIALPLALAASACGADTSEPWPTPISETYEVIIESAIETGASQTQLDELRQYANRTTIPVSVIEGARTRAFECLDAAGLSYLPESYEPYPGFVVLTFGFGDSAGALDDETILRLGNSCADQEYTWINSMYENQPAAIALRDSAFDDAREGLVSCLAEFGIDIAADSSREEFEAAAVSLLADGTVLEPTCFPPS